MEKLVLTGTVCFCVGLTVGLILDHVMKHSVENACFILVIRNNAKKKQENGQSQSTSKSQ